MAKEENTNSTSESGKTDTKVTPNGDHNEHGENLEQQLEQARAEAAGNLDNFLRAKAETENIRRRSAEEVIKARKFAVEQLAGELLAVRDSLELASQISTESEDSPVLRQIHEGIVLTLKLLDSAFDKAAITVVDPAGEKFDPELHQAMSVTESDEVAPDHVVSVIQKGYRIDERLLRPALVVVAKAAPTGVEVDEKTDGAEA